MICSYRNVVVGGLLSCCLLAPGALSAASGCTTAQLLGVYGAEVTSIGFQSVLALPPTTTATPVVVVGFGSNPNSLSGNLSGLGRYYFDGTGNVVGVTATTSTSPSINTNLGSYSVSTDCSATVKLNSGATYDLYLAQNGTEARYVRTDTTGGGELGLLRRSGTCVSLGYPGSFAFQVSGGTKQTDTSGVSTLSGYSAAGTLSLNGSGGFSIAETLFSSAGLQRGLTAGGSYKVGDDCSVTLTFSSDSSSKGFVAPKSFRFLMVNADTGLLAVQPDSNTTLTGTVIAQ